MRTIHALAARLRAAVLILMALSVCAPASRAANAGPPETMSYQGFLVDASGVALGNTAPKNYDVIFRLWNAQSAGDRLWAEQQTVTVDKGYFSVLLGEGSAYASEPRPALSTLFRATPDVSDRFVEFTVRGIGALNNDVTILPRLRLLTSPYAFLAQNAVALVSGTNPIVTSTTLGYVGINTANPAAQLDVNGAVKATSFAGDGAGLTALDAAKVTTGKLADGRLSPNVALLNASQLFTGVNTFYSLAGNGAGLTNLSASSLVKEVVDALCPPGTIVAFGGPTNKIPSGWLWCDGRAVKSSDYPRLYAAIGKAWGDGSFDRQFAPESDSATDFNLPDLRTVFLRGADADAHSSANTWFWIDPDRDSRIAPRAGGNAGNAVGSVQDHQFRAHTHQIHTSGIWGRSFSGENGWPNTAYQADGPTDATGGLETRPKNAYVNYIVKY